MDIQDISISRVAQLACSACGQSYEHEHLHTFATCCNKPLLVKYNLDKKLSKAILKDRPADMWRYRELLPLLDEENKVSLGEGFTPLTRLNRIAAQYGFSDVYLKDESYNPSGSFKARGISMAISKAKELGATSCIIPTAGNAGGALSAYCARAGMPASVIMPAWTPKIFIDECKLHGAEVILIDGLINECGKKAAEISKNTGAFDISTLKEPYRIEGKKTMGYEIAEQLNWELPDVIIYPAGGGTGLIGIWKAFQEMKTLGWISGSLPRMIAVQTENCQPLVKAYDDSMGQTNTYTGPKASLANGLAVPYPFGLDLMMQVLTESKGLAVSVSEEDIVAGVRELAQKEGLLLCPEGAAVWKALIQLKAQNQLQGHERIVLLNTGSGYKYLENVI